MTVVLAIAVMILFAVLMSIGLLIRGKEIKGTCASQNPLLLKDGVECGVCGKPVGACENETKDDQIATA
ncbi:hypothetical protein [uncultured Microscilla sp.]|uniref:hypothetical protein n=1 Tax=uncultured Microscilla sp. TaxID=432653 RepID=UPI0026349648|nr:hypothetical protein [uncultured Microscilla sp.]